MPNTTNIPAGQPANGGVRPSDDHLMALGKLTFLAAFCPLHKTYPGSALASLFFPAINHGCVRFFEDDNGATAAALIWARLSDEVSERMLFQEIPPDQSEWVSGTNLWFMDLIAPFGHGPEVARHIARNPPEGRFFFARLGKGGRLRKIVEGDASRGRRGLVQSHLVGAH
ncbi:toxin-activating lysine-acyltransferase [Maritimibacter sp. DP1N21-5]|uniref:toxin-activating lysine-acyltransferase n=1 Tax=Maritimibacter sp. DP1N21-5 TaxID=2836867 RepID=UPI001C436CCE|nr:toxin-activating lysine-acyltransferase [Maritimibacter sp. DP1N21-5]MBV7409141.1 toxin-activating lysine-acyltransferase [Maritimibacter sp. DP1N21-5]